MSGECQTICFISDFLQATQRLHTCLWDCCIWLKTSQGGGIFDHKCWGRLWKIRDVVRTIKADAAELFPGKPWTQAP